MGVSSHGNGDGWEFTVAMASTPPATPPAMKDTDGGTGASWAGIVHDASPSLRYHTEFCTVGWVIPDDVIDNEPLAIEFLMIIISMAPGSLRSLRLFSW